MIKKNSEKKLVPETNQQQKKNLTLTGLSYTNNSSNSKMNGKEFSNLYIHIENIIECHTRISWPLTITFTFKS